MSKAKLRLKADFWTSFKPIPDYPDYQINHYGQVLSYRCKSKPILMSKSNQRRGYPYVELKKDDNNTIKPCKFSVHRLVATVFLPNPYNYTIVDHINGIKYDNRLCNLRWTNNLGNSSNRFSHKNSTSKFVGVCKNGKFWRTALRHNGIVVLDLRKCQTEMEAVLARDQFIIDNNLTMYKLNVLTRP